MNKITQGKYLLKLQRKKTYLCLSRVSIDQTSMIQYYMLQSYTHLDHRVVAYQEILFGGSTNSVEGRGQGERGSGDGSPLDRGSGGSCNLVQEISFHIVKFS